MLTINELLSKGILLFDGAMGTSIQKFNLPDVDPPELINLNHPDKLKEIHLKYIEAGSNIIETNTFGGSRLRLNLSDLGDKVKEINTAAVRIAKEAAKGKAYVAGSVGPLGVLIEPYGELSSQEAFNTYKEQIEILLEAGVDLILIETMISLDEALIALKAAKEAGSKITGVTLTFDSGALGLRTSFGESPSDAILKLKESGADFVGSNCGHGLTDILLAAEEMKKVSDLPILIQPNAGLPEFIDGNIVYNESPEMFMKFTQRAISLGVNFIGGCCGTTDLHIKAANSVLRKSS